MPLTEKYGSKKEIKAAMRTRKNSGLFHRLAPEERFKFRPIVEPTEWEKGYFHYMADADIKFMWCSRRKDCPRCEINHKPQSVWLANVLDIENGKVQILQLPAGIANLLYERYEKYGTICDRDYEILRQGSGLNDTKYMLDWDDKLVRKLSRWYPADIPAAIKMELGLEADDVDDDEPEGEIPTAYRGKKSSPKKSPRYEEEEDDEDEDYDEDEDDDEEVDQYAELDRSELKAEIKKYNSAFVAKKSQSDEDLRDILRELAEDEDADDEDDEDDEEDEEEEPVRPSRKTSGKVSSTKSVPVKSKTKRVIRRA